MDEKFKKLETLFKMMTDSLTRDEFVKSFEAMTQFILKIEQRIEKSAALLEKTYDGVVKKLEETNASGFEKLEKQVLGQINSLFLKNRINEKLSFFDEEHIMKIKELDKKMEEVDNKMAKVRDGKDADEIKIVQTVLSQIKLPEQKELILDGPDEIRNKLELLNNEDRLDVSAIRGIKEMLLNMDQQIKDIAQRPIYAGPSANAVLVYDLSAQCDGQTKTFIVPRHRLARRLEGSQFPFVYRPTVDYTTADKILTLTSEVAPPESGQTLIFDYVK